VEREEISKSLWAGDDLSVIANRLGREATTISREVKNNCRYKRCYQSATRSSFDFKYFEYLLFDFVKCQDLTPNNLFSNGLCFF